MRVEEAVPEAATGGGIAWPVVIIGGIIIVAGVVAVRGEFANMRQRRSERSDRRR